MWLEFIMEVYARTFPCGLRKSCRSFVLGLSESDAFVGESVVGTSARVSLLRPSPVFDFLD